MRGRVPSKPLVVVLVELSPIIFRVDTFLSVVAVVADVWMRFVQEVKDCKVFR